MTDPIFQEACFHVRGCYSLQDWLILSPRNITTLIYRECGNPI